MKPSSRFFEMLRIRGGAGWVGEQTGFSKFGLNLARPPKD